MEQKDQKDMTTSELLRSGGSSFFNTLADKIDAELAQARRSGLERAAKSWAKDNGWPDFREGEDFGAWLDRCAYKKPVDDCNEPVQFGDEIELHFSGGGMEEGRFQEVNLSNGPIMILSFTGVDHEHLYRYDTECDTIKRPAPEALGADGLPIKVGETVYRLSDGTSWTVTELHHSEPRISVMSIDGNEVTSGGWFLASEYTHTLPDSQERIDKDKKKTFSDYWDCWGVTCNECPTNIDGRTPMAHYGVLNCSIAQGIDIARRQRELDKRTGSE